MLFWRRTAIWLRLLVHFWLVESYWYWYCSRYFPDKHAQFAGRTRHYHQGIFLLGYVIETILLKRLSKPERCRLFYIAALMARMDDLSDHHHGMVLPNDLHDYVQTIDPSGKAWSIFCQLRLQLPDEQSKDFEKQAFALMRAETANLVSGSFEIMDHKGGHAVLCCRQLIAPRPTKSEVDFLMALGDLLQRSDDIVDLWVDRRAGYRRGVAQVLASTSEGHLQLQEWLSAQKQLTTNLILVLRLNAQSQRRLEAVLDAVSALAELAIDQYQSVRMPDGNLPWHDRRSMVVDMTRWSNRWAFVKRILGVQCF